MPTKFIAFAVVIPFALLCLLIARAELHVSQGQEWQFEIQGYDPRDLLRGHYLLFQPKYNWGKNSETCAKNSDCCICLKDIGEQAPLVSRTDCSTAKSQCDGFMQNDFAGELNRYYIAENYAKKAEDILRDARAENNAYLSVSVSKKGKPQIVDMLIKGKSLNELLKNEALK